VLVPGEEDENDLSLLSSRRLAYLPAAALTYSTWYHRRYMYVTRVQTQTGRRGSKEESLQIRSAAELLLLRKLIDCSILTRHHRVLNELLLEAKKEYMAAGENSIGMYISDTNNNWNHVASRPKRNIVTLFFKP
jgi:chaperone BCS1